MRDLANRCDMRVGNLQYYFPTRDSVVMAVIAAEAEEDIRIMKTVMERQADAESQLSALVRTLFSRWRGESGLIFAALIYLCLHKPPFVELKLEIYATFYQLLGSLVQSLSTNASPAEIRQRVSLITAIIDGSVLQATGGPSSFVDAMIGTVIDTARGTIGRRP